MMEVRINNQRQTLKNAIDNVNAGRYEFKSGKRVFNQFVEEVKSNPDYLECQNLLDQADREMTKPLGQKKAPVQKKKKGKWMGIF